MNTTKFNPITLNLIKNLLESTVDEMALTIVRTAYSSNLKNSMDFSTGFCSRQGELIAQGLCLPLHLGSLPDGMDAILKKYDGKIYPGDVFILNDPYEGGTHLPDIYIIKLSAQRNSGESCDACAGRRQRLDRISSGKCSVRRVSTGRA